MTDEEFKKEVEKYSKQISELQKKNIDLQTQLTEQKAVADKATTENKVLQETNQQLFIRATKVAKGEDPDEEDEKKKETEKSFFT